jgi:hypothetical protein
LILWSKAEAGSDLQKLAITITPLLDDNNYAGIEKVLIQYKAKQNQMNQIPESEKQEKESKILVQMREFYKGSHFATADIGVDPDKMSYADFIARNDFLPLFRKDPIL